MSVDVLVLTPPKKAVLRNIISHNVPPRNQGIDSIPLRLAAVVESEFSVGFYPFSYTQYNVWEINENEIFDVLKIYDPKIVIVSTDYFISNRATSYFNSTLLMGKIIKKYNNNITIIATGKHCIVSSYDFFKYNNRSIDYVIRSEAELIINKLIRALLNCQSTSNIPSLLYFDGNNIIESKLDNRIVNFNNLPSPAYHLLLPYINKLYELEKPYAEKITLTLRTSYGCVFNCHYCGGNNEWNHYRTRSADKVLEDIESALAVIGDWCEFSFLDDELFTYDFQHVKEIANLFDKYDIKLYGVLTHVNFFNNEIAAQLARFCRFVLFGGENFVNDVLIKLDKKQSLQTIKAACQIAHLSGLKIRLEYIIGLPYESPYTIIQNLNYMYNLIVDGTIDKISPYILVPHPGTEYGKNPKKYGISITDYNYDHYVEVDYYPTFKTLNLSSNQIYIYYLLANKTINQAIRIREQLGQLPAPKTAKFNKKLFIEFFENINSEGIDNENK